jgi:hypothetical protein
MDDVHPTWHLTGEYFENCNCDIVCPCLVSAGKPLTATPTQGTCEVLCGFHIDSGRYGEVPLDDLNAATAYVTPGPMGEGNWAAAIYVDERGSEAQRDALYAIFSGEAGGPVSGLAPFITKLLGVRAVPMVWRQSHASRSLEIPGTMNARVRALETWNPDETEPIWAVNAHPYADRVAMAVGDSGSTWVDFDMRWDNSGKWGDYAPITWSSD